MRLLGIAVVASAVFGLIHCYLWWRLVRNTTRPGRWRRLGTITIITLGLLLLAALFGSRAAHWLAWPGYLWLAVMFYLLVLLLLLELPRSVAPGHGGRHPVVRDQRGRFLGPTGTGRRAARHHPGRVARAVAPDMS